MCCSKGKYLLQRSTFHYEIKVVSLSSFNYVIRTPLLLFYSWYGSKGNPGQNKTSTLKPTLMRTEIFLAFKISVACLLSLNCPSVGPACIKIIYLSKTEVLIA